MMRNKIFGNRRGLSTIVVTLIIILLSLVSIGVVWVVVNNLIKSGTSGVEIGTKCLGVDVVATAVTCTPNGVDEFCSTTLSRTGTGTGEIGGVKLVFSNATSGATSASVIDVAGNIEQLITKNTGSINSTLLVSQGVNKVEVTVYFNDEEGNAQLCSRTSPFNF
jgi:hypothetical protein